MTVNNTTFGGADNLVSAGILVVACTAYTGTDASFFGSATIEIYLPENTTDYTFVKETGGALSNTTGEMWIGQAVGMWENVAAITSLTILPNVGTTFEIGNAGEPTVLTWRLYGVY
jgi:hypothetical protein